MNIREIKPRTIERLISIGLIILVLGVFSQVAWHDFVNFDDEVYVTKNSLVQSGLSGKGIRWAFTSMEAKNWHPVTWLSHMFDCQLYGLNPAGHHLTNLFLHVANSLLLFLVLRTATGSLWKSAMVAALFGIHPLHVESVAWVAERKDVLSTFFWMLTMLAYVYYCRKPGTRRYIGVTVLFAIGLMAKPMLVTLPFVLLLFDFWPLGRLTFSGAGGDKCMVKSLRQLVWEKMPFLVLSAGSSIVTFLVQNKGGAVATFEAIPLKARVLNALVTYVRYLEKMMWPHDMSVFYPYEGHSLTLWYGVAAALLLAAISAFTIQQRPNRPFLLVGWFWFLGVLVPVIGIVQVGAQSMADRYTYLPSIGIFIMCVWGFSGIIKGLPYSRLVSACVGTAILISLSIVTWLQLPYWQDSKTLFRHAFAVTSRNHLAHSNLGNALLDEDRLDEAAAEYKKALDIWPAYPDALNNLGVVCVRKGWVEEAIGYYGEAIKADPECLLAYMNIADNLIKIGRLSDAASYLSQALLVNPDHGRAHSVMGVILARLKKTNEAIAHLIRAIDICPDCPEPRNNLGRILALKGDFEGAIEQLEIAIEIRPDYAEARNNLGLVFVELGALDEALYWIASALHFRTTYTKASTNLQKVMSMVCDAAPDQKKPLQPENPASANRDQ